MSKRLAALLLLLRQCRSNLRLCRKDELSTQSSFDIVAFFGNNVESYFNIVAKNGNDVEATFDIVAFDYVALTLLLVWTGLKTDFSGQQFEGFHLGHLRRKQRWVRTSAAAASSLSPSLSSQFSAHTAVKMSVISFFHPNSTGQYFTTLLSSALFA